MRTDSNATDVHAVDRARLYALLDARFPGQLHHGSSRWEIARIEAAHPGVGGIVILDDYDEVTVFIGAISHSHYPADADLVEPDRTDAVSRAVGGFLEELFADRILLWKGCFGMAGGWRPRREGDAPRRRRGILVQRYIWSGPLDGA